jgi:hypothetical protein
MASTQQVGFSQRIQLPWLEYTAQLSLAGKTREEVNAALQDLLQDKLSVGHQVQRGNREKAITILLKIWFNPPERLVPLRDEGLELFQKIKSRQHLALHWGMSMAVYPFFGGVAGVVGKLLRLQDQIGTAQVQRRIREQLGERDTVARAARRIYRSFIDWAVLSETGTKGTYAKSPPLRISDPQLTAWLFECILQANGTGWTPKASLDGHPALFPFAAHISAREALQGRRTVESIRHGLDQELVRLEKHS